MSVIVDTYHKCKCANPERLVLFVSGKMASFLSDDAHEVSRLLGEPISYSRTTWCHCVTFGVQRVPEIFARLTALGRKITGLRREDKPPRKWLPFSFERPPDISKLDFAHKFAYVDALDELKNGRRETDWIWFAFPRMTGSWDSSGDRGLRTLCESRLVLKQKTIANHIREMANVLLNFKGTDIVEVLGSEGAIHTMASATLFAITAKSKDDRTLFGAVLDRLFGGKRDGETINSIRRELKSPRDDTPSDIALSDNDESIVVHAAYHQPRQPKPST